MLRRLLWIAMFATPLMLAGCPGESDVGDDIEEGMEEIGDEIDDAL